MVCVLLLHAYGWLIVLRAFFCFCGEFYLIAVCSFSLVFIYVAAVVTCF